MAAAVQLLIHLGAAQLQLVKMSAELIIMQAAAAVRHKKLEQQQPQAVQVETAAAVQEQFLVAQPAEAVHQLVLQVLPIQAAAAVQMPTQSLAQMVVQEL
jgi:hypothetical protein